jgi:hypothetical protein
LLVLAALTFAVAAVALQYLSPSLFKTSRHFEPDPKSAEVSRNLFLAVQQESLRQIENRPVYKYSVVPGGVRDVHELKWAAEHDPVVAAHYAGFDYDHARLVRLVLARTAYVSYRIGNKIYWTRRRISLKAGETLITDGKITARTRCANRVEEIPQQASSESEPPAEKFDEPVSPGLGTAMASPPVPFQSSLMNRNPVAGLGPAPPLTFYDPLAGGNFPSVFPPPLPNVCGIGIGKKPRPEPIGIRSTSGGKKHGTGDPCSSGGGTVPEPGSWFLVATGLALILWKVRQRFLPSTLS